MAECRTASVPIGALAAAADHLRARERQKVDADTLRAPSGPASLFHVKRWRSPVRARRRIRRRAEHTAPVCQVKHPALAARTWRDRAPTARPATTVQGTNSAKMFHVKHPSHCLPRRTRRRYPDLRPLLRASRPKDRTAWASSPSPKLCICMFHVKHLAGLLAA